MDESTFMRRALELAEGGRGHVEPNPLVGAVLVRAGKIVGEGHHQKFGGPHAEIVALDAAGEAARGATLYVTLEPCCHHGKTPPCTEALIRAGVSQVVAALEDPFPQVAGRGAELLRAAGILVDFGLCREEAARQNAPYLTLLHQRRPHVHAKWAMTLDGKIATRTGDSQWISNEASRRKVHGLRGRMDGILVGSGTALADDPLLTARPPGPRSQTRVVLDSGCRLTHRSQLARTARKDPVLVVTTNKAAGANLAALIQMGCETRIISEADDAKVSLPRLLRELGDRRWTNLLVEGGAKVLGSFFDAGLVDEVHVFIAPRIVGGASAPGPVAGMGVETLAKALRLQQPTVEVLEGDIYLHGLVDRNSEPRTTFHGTDPGATS